MTYIKPKNYQGDNLEGNWLFTKKLDGVRMLRDDEGNPVSRSGKPLHNLQNIPEDITDAEIFIDNWDTSVSAVRTHNADPIAPSAAYSITPIDPRLVIGITANPTPTFIARFLAKAVACGYEGLVLYGPKGKVLKVKPEDSYDLEILDIIEGKGKRTGCVGKMRTSKGAVGIFKGFTEKNLAEMWKNKDNLIGSIGEFACMHLTKTGKMRHGKLVRLRFDKTEENPDATP